jgi:hypothetical protein
MSCPDEPVPPTTLPPEPQPESLINFESIERNNYEVICKMGITGDTGQIFTLNFEYQIIATADNIGSDGLESNSNETSLYISIDSGSTWSHVDTVYAQVSGGNYPIAQDDTQTIDGTFSLNSVTNIDAIRFKGVLSCDAGRAGKFSDVSVKIDTVDVNIGTTQIICQNGFNGGCYSGESLYCNLTPTTTTTSTTSTTTTTLAPAIPTTNTIYIHIPIL